MGSDGVFYVDIDGKKVKAEILITFSFYGNFYCAYCISNDDTKLNDVYSAKVVNNTLVNIEDEKEKQIIDQYIYNLLSIVKER